MTLQKSLILLNPTEYGSAASQFGLCLFILVFSQHSLMNYQQARIIHLYLWRKITIFLRINEQRIFKFSIISAKILQQNLNKFHSCNPQKLSFKMILNLNFCPLYIQFYFTKTSEHLKHVCPLKLMAIVTCIL